MKRSIVTWQLLGYAVTVFLGSLLHFVYGWSGGSRWAALFGSVNESTFEHMKLFFFPAFAFALFERRFFRDDGAFWCVKLRGILRGIVLIPALYYTLNGVFGKTPDWVNIATFFLAAAGRSFGRRGASVAGAFPVGRGRRRSVFCGGSRSCSGSGPSSLSGSRCSVIRRRGDTGYKRKKRGFPSFFVWFRERRGVISGRGAFQDRRSGRATSPPPSGDPWR